MSGNAGFGVQVGWRGARQYREELRFAGAAAGAGARGQDALGHGLFCPVPWLGPAGRALAPGRWQEEPEWSPGALRSPLCYRESPEDPGGVVTHLSAALWCEPVASVQTCVVVRRLAGPWDSGAV